MWVKQRNNSKTDANRTFSGDMHMEFGLDKCTKTVFKKQKLIHSHNLMFDIN